MCTVYRTLMQYFYSLLALKSKQLCFIKLNFNVYKSQMRTSLIWYVVVPI